MRSVARGACALAAGRPRRRMSTAPGTGAWTFRRGVGSWREVIGYGPEAPGGAFSRARDIERRDTPRRAARCRAPSRRVVMRIAHLTAAGGGRWAFRMYVMRFAHLAAPGGGRWAFRMYVMRFAHFAAAGGGRWAFRMHVMRLDYIPADRSRSGTTSVRSAPSPRRR
jgi:hypothetical protein